MNLDNLARLIAMYNVWTDKLGWDTTDCAAAMILRVKGEWTEARFGITVELIQEFLDVPKDVARALFFMHDYKNGKEARPKDYELFWKASDRDQRYIITNTLGRLGVSGGKTLIWNFNLRAPLRELD